MSHTKGGVGVLIAAIKIWTKGSRSLCSGMVLVNWITLMYNKGIINGHI